MLSCLFMGIQGYMGGDMGYVYDYWSLKCYPNDMYWYEMLCMLNRWNEIWYEIIGVLQRYMTWDDRWYEMMYDLWW